MPVTKKTTGYRITIKAFVPAKLGDMDAYREMSERVEKARAIVGPNTSCEIATDRRALD